MAVSNESKIMSCDYCRRLGATYKRYEYGSVFNWCNKHCFDMYVHGKDMKEVGP